MVEQYDLGTLAKALSFDQRRVVLTSLKETDLRLHLRSLMIAMEPNAVVEITHGTEELGKDLVMVKRTKFGQEVTAAVVKAGVVGGKTMGKADEIATQVEDCFLHPAKLKTMSGVFPVEKVWIMVAGEFTVKGQQKLEARTKNRPVKLFDVKWLVEQFTDYYPQVFFEGGIVDFLKTKILELEKTRMVSSCGSALSESWVEPLVASLETPITFDEEALTIIFENNRLPFSQLKQIALSAKPRRIILAGDPGTGKSTALAKLSLDVLKESFNLVVQRRLDDATKITVPVLILAKDMVKFEDSGALLTTYIPQEETRDRFCVNLLVVDGLDEVSPPLRSGIVEKATEFSQQMDCSVIIASRKVETIKNPIVEYGRFELLPFDFGRALNLFKKLVRDTQLLGVLRDGLQKIRFQILMTPLSLSLLIDIADQYKEIPASITELYERFTDIALGRFDKDKGIEVLFEYEIKKRFLAQLAFTHFLEMDRLEIPSSEFSDFVRSYAKLYRMDEGRLGAFVQEVDRSGMLRMGETISFCHRSFLDYFAAYSIFVRQDTIEDLDDLIAKLYFSDGWGEVAFFYIGSKREIAEATVNKLFSFDTEGFGADIDRFLVGRLLQAGWHSLSETKTQAMRQSLDFAPSIRDRLLDAAKKQQVGFPQIFGDFLLLALCEIGFVSAFLQKEEQLLFDDLSKKADSRSLYSSLLLLWSMRRSLSSDELRLAINSLLSAMSGVPNLSSDEQARMLLLCSSLERQEKTTTGAVKRKLDRLQKKNPGVFKELLPHARKGFRRPATKTQR